MKSESLAMVVGRAAVANDIFAGAGGGAAEAG